MTIANSLSDKPQGFVLVAVIWILAAASLLITFIASQLEEMQNHALKLEAKHLARFDRIAIESAVLYLGATRTRSYSGLRTVKEVENQNKIENLFSKDIFRSQVSDIRLDSRTYLVRGGYELSLQDAGSLISLRSERLETLKNLLRAYSVEGPAAERMIATLLDYTDLNDYVHLNGAEGNDYSAANKLPPTNRFLTSPFQLYNVIGWRHFLDEHPDFFNEVTIYVGDQRNYNFLTKRGLQIAPEIGLEESARLMNFRADSAFSDLRMVNEISGALVDGDLFSLSFVPSPYLRLRLLKPNSGEEYWIGITFSPESNLAPWEIDYRVTRSFIRREYDVDRKLDPTIPASSFLK